MTIEETLRTAVETVVPVYHLDMDGEQEKCAVYRLNSERVVMESGEPICRTEIYDIEVCQSLHDPTTVTDVIQALRAAGFFARITGSQQMVELNGANYSIDKLSASMTRGME